MIKNNNDIFEIKIEHITLKIKEKEINLIANKIESKIKEE